MCGLELKVTWFREPKIISGVGDDAVKVIGTVDLPTSTSDGRMIPVCHQPKAGPSASGRETELWVGCCLSTLYRALHDGRPVFWCWRVHANSAKV